MTKILIVEDHAGMLEILVKVIGLMGFTPIASRTGKEGIEKAIADRPNLVLMDIMMPEMDGWEATRILRSHPGTKDLPILAATVLVRPSDLQKCIDVGCNDYIVKPFTAKALRKRIQDLI